MKERQRLFILTSEGIEVQITFKEEKYEPRVSGYKFIL